MTSLLANECLKSCQVKPVMWASRMSLCHELLTLVRRSPPSPGNTRPSSGLLLPGRESRKRFAIERHMPCLATFGRGAVYS